MESTILVSLRLLIAGSILLIWQGASAQLAFPGAEGFGATTPGGRGGRIVAVTNTNDSGPGSFREACQASGPRIVVFRTGGTITLETTVKIEDPYITIAGQSAPGGGICLRSSTDASCLSIKTHDVVMRYIRIRPGSGITPEGSDTKDALVIKSEDAYNIIVDHCTFTWGVDETVSTYSGNPDFKVNNITFQWNIISDALDCNTHIEGCHSKGLLLQYAEKITIHHNLFANNGARSPLLLSGEHDLVNNVIYNWGGSAVKIENRYGDVFLNFVNNYLAPGKDSDMSENGIQVKTEGINLYLENNIAEHTRPDNSYPQDAIVNYREPATLVGTRFQYPYVSTTSAQQAYDDVLDGVGATLPARDKADEDIIKGVRNRTGRIIDYPSDVGGYPFLAPGTPYTDTDNDGMPDDWEISYGLDPDDPSDGPMDKDADGYTNVEEFLNGLVDEPAPTTDCNGDAEGSAFLDDCGDCVGGNTGAEPCVPLAKTWQAEDAVIGGGAEINSEHAGHNGSGFVNFPKDNGYVQFNNVDGGEGGVFDLTLRYALGRTSRMGSLLINGQAQNITVTSTGSWTSWSTKTVSVNLQSGVNTIRIESTGGDFGNLDEITVSQPAAARQLMSDQPEAATTLVYPNPSDGVFTLQLSQGSAVTITNTNAQVVYQEILAAGRRTIDISSAPAGIYVLDDGTQRLRLVVE